jgi:peptidoglycan-associated lipoprotein
MRQQRIWISLLSSIFVLAVLGCHRQKPVTPATTPAPMAQEAPKATPPPAPEAPPVAPQPPQPAEDPLLSKNFEVVNQELVRRGFVPDVYFDFNVSSLSEETRARLSTDAGILKSVPSLKLTLEGHCDERGTAEYNLALGDRRASAVKDYLDSLGIDPGRLQTISYGLERPVCTEHEESCWSKNRRVHLIATGRSGAS